MGKKRLTRSAIIINDPYRPRKSTATDLIGRLFEDMNQFNYNREILMPLTESIRQIQGSFQGKSLILSGTASCGKTSTVLWLCKDFDLRQYHIITLDCRIHETDNQFIDYLARQIGIYIKKQNFNKSIVVNQNINFNSLNQHITSGDHKFIIILKFAQKLIKPKQLLLYNFFQWINNNYVKDYISVIICTRTLTFCDKLQKRIKSRMNLPFIYIPLPRPKDVIDIINKRIQYRLQNTQDEDQIMLLSKLERAINHNKELDKILQFQYKNYPKGIVFYLKMMQLLLIQDLDMQKWQKSNENMLRALVAQSFRKNGDYISQYKEISKNIYKNLPFPEIILLGLIRRRFSKQKKGNFKIQSTLSSFLQDFNDLKIKNALQSQGSNYHYNFNVFEAALRHLKQINFLTITQNQGLNIIYKQIKSQYSPEDIKQFFSTLTHLPEFIKEIYLQF